MDTFDIVTIIAIILFARLGVRLFGTYISNKNIDETEDEDQS